MKIISIDVGTKNASYCVMGKNPDKTITIYAWKRVQLFSESEIIEELHPQCDVSVLRKKKTEPCGKRAYFYGNNKDNLSQHFCCKSHALAHTTKPIMIAKNMQKKGRLAKIELSELQALWRCSPGICSLADPLPSTKKKCIEEIILSEEIGTLRLIPKSRARKINGNNVRPIEISESLTTIFDNESALDSIDEAIIEQQIRDSMIKVQDLLMQYFMCKLKTSEKVHIVSAKHKLEGFVRPKHLMTKKCKYLSKANHYKNKQSGKIHCAETIKKLVPLGPCDWIAYFHEFDEDKQDDLADCFLQGLWRLSL